MNTMQMTAFQFGVQNTKEGVTVTFGDNAERDNHYVSIEWDLQEHCSRIEIDDQIFSANDAISEIKLSNRELVLHIMSDKVQFTKNIQVIILMPEKDKDWPREVVTAIEWLSARINAKSKQ